MRKVLVLAVLILIFAFLGIPTPNWLDAIVKSIASLITSIVNAFLNVFRLIMILAGIKI